MEYLGESKAFLGLTLAAFSTATCIFAPLFGILEVKSHDLKAIIVISASAKLFGNLLYSIPFNGYFPLFGRFISGIGESTIGVLYGAVIKCTTNKNRAKAFLYFEGLYTVGAMFGPSIGSVIVFNVNIFGWEINAGNSPGVLLVTVWVFLLMLAVFLPSDLAENSQAEEIQQDPDSDKNSGDEIIEEESSISCTPSTVGCLYYLAFLTVVCYSVISFYTPLLAVYHLGLKLIHVKLIYVNSSLAVFILYIATYLILHKISEKKCFFVAFVSAIVPISITFYFALMWNNAITANAAYLLLISMIIMSVKFMNFALACSLLSKITPSNRAAFYQSLIFTSNNIGMIVARVIAGATFDKIPMICSCLGLVTVWVFGVIWMAFEYKNLPPKASIDK
ncbi:MFS transporter ceroid lipofuscinosis neuronal [Paramuricea clavata]|uniref:MFS transporter ceroid lipofuscinosis neuronal n=1 Tax=Paramuricea clavata TaxID=317549 RepID=A0A7D9HNM9_PARCT|nr:MFS transporter ceroid lipofuscinosis neuronal [Paramuricea clavata]